MQKAPCPFQTRGFLFDTGQGLVNVTPPTGCQPVP